MSPGMTGVPQNLVLRSLSAEDFWTIRPHLRRVPFVERSIVQEQRRAIDHIDFVETGLVSLRATAAGSVMETAVVGSQGVLGASAILGSRAAPHQSVVLIAGSALRIEVGDLLCAIAKRSTIRDQILAYIDALMIHGAQIALCCARHSIGQRLACWICVATDAANGRVLPITHDDLSINLGLRRAGITETLASFEAAGLIRKMRGVLEVLQRDELERISCCCYRVIASGYRVRMKGGSRSG